MQTCRLPRAVYGFQQTLTRWLSIIKNTWPLRSHHRHVSFRESPSLPDWSNSHELESKNTIIDSNSGARVARFNPPRRTSEMVGWFPLYRCRPSTHTHTHTHTTRRESKERPRLFNYARHMRPYFPSTATDVIGSPLKSSTQSFFDTVFTDNISSAPDLPDNSFFLIDNDICWNLLVCSSGMSVLRVCFW